VEGFNQKNKNAGKKIHPKLSFGGGRNGECLEKGK